MAKKILPGHGSGGKLMNEMIDTVIRKRFGGDSVQLDDSAVLSVGNASIAFTTDTFTITPIFFPGGDIGKLAVNGTVNDLAVMGATPLWISCALILEEGLDFADLERILDSMKSEADSAGVKIVTGDTKVVPSGQGGQDLHQHLRHRRVREKGPAPGDIVPGDRIIISGTIGDHGMAVMALRNNLSFSKGLAVGLRPSEPHDPEGDRGVSGQREIHARPDPGRRRVGTERNRKGEKHQRETHRRMRSPSGKR